MKPLRKISQKTKKSLDDGSVKGLILSNDYSTAGEGVAIQNIVNGISTWVICGGGCCPHAMKVSAKRGKIYWETAEEAMEEVLSFCRGEFKKEEILLCSVNSFYLLESGVVFLEDRLCSFNQKKLGHIIPYADMENVCLDGNSVTIKVSNGTTTVLPCGDDREYSRSMYNLLTDIQGRLEQA